jgi:hypothetical protein
LPERPEKGGQTYCLLHRLICLLYSDDAFINFPIWAHERPCADTDHRDTRSQRQCDLRERAIFTTDGDDGCRGTYNERVASLAKARRNGDVHPGIGLKGISPRQNANGQATHRLGAPAGGRHDSAQTTANDRRSGGCKTRSHFFGNCDEGLGCVTATDHGDLNCHREQAYALARTRSLEILTDEIDSSGPEYGSGSATTMMSIPGSTGVGTAPADPAPQYELYFANPSGNVVAFGITPKWTTASACQRPIE